MAVSARLDRLLERLADIGERSSRKEIVAALLEDSPPRSGDLDRLVRQMRSSPLADVVLAGDELERYLRAETRRGPRLPETRRRATTGEQEPLFLLDPATCEPGTPVYQLPTVAVGLSVPRRLAGRLNALTGSVEAAGGQATKSEVVAALVLAAPTDPDALSELLRRYRSGQQRRLRAAKGPRR